MATFVWKRIVDTNINSQLQTASNCKRQLNLKVHAVPLIPEDTSTEQKRIYAKGWPGGTESDPAAKHSHRKNRESENNWDPLVLES